MPKKVNGQACMFRRENVAPPARECCSKALSMFSCQNFAILIKIWLLNAKTNLKARISEIWSKP